MKKNMNEINLDGSDNNLKPENMPEKFWDEKNSSVRIDALLKSYLELEKMFSNQKNGSNILKQSVDANAADAENFKIELASDLVAINQNMNLELIEAGFSIEQIQKVYDIIETKILPEVIEFAGQIYYDNEIQKLENHFGGEEKFAKIAKQIQMWAEKNINQETLNVLASNFQGVVALYEMMIKSEPLAMGDFDCEDEANSAEDLRKMMQDPKYWRDQDAAFINKVSEGFKKLYN